MSLFDVSSTAQLPFLAISVLDYSAFGFLKFVYDSEEENNVRVGDVRAP